MDGRTYRDVGDVPMEDIYAYLEQDRPFLTTPGSPHDYIEAYREVAQWASAIVCLTISKELSTMFDSAHTAMEMAKDVIPEVSIQVLDCGSLAGAQGLIVLAAATRAMAGDSLKQVIAAAGPLSERQASFFSLRLFDIPPEPGAFLECWPGSELYSASRPSSPLLMEE